MSAQFTTITGEYWKRSLTAARKRFAHTSDHLRSQIPDNHKTPMSLRYPIQTYAKPEPRLSAVEKWAHKRDEGVAALRAGWSVHAVVRALSVPEQTVSRWKREENIPNHTGPKKPMPEVGQKLT